MTNPRGMPGPPPLGLNIDWCIRRKMAVDGIPIVDFSAMSLENKNPLSEDDPIIRDLADQVYQAFSTIGFVYLRNHGIPQEMVGGYLNTSLFILRKLAYYVSSES